MPNKQKPVAMVASYTPGPILMALMSWKNFQILTRLDLYQQKHDTPLFSPYSLFFFLIYLTNFTPDKCCRIHFKLYISHPKHDASFEFDRKADHKVLTVTMSMGTWFQTLKKKILIIIHSYTFVSNIWTLNYLKESNDQ